MHVALKSRRAEIAELCRRLGVRRLHVFGSATGDAFDVELSDADFVVEFDSGSGLDYFDTYFSLKEGLEYLLDRPVGLLTRSSIENPYFRAQLEQTEEPIYVG